MNQLECINPDGYFNQIKQYKNIILFGCGGKGRQAISILENQGIKLTAVCDNNINLFGKEFIQGLYIKSLEEVLENLKSFCIIITASMKNAMEIYDDLIQKYGKIPIYHLCSPFKVENVILPASDLQVHFDALLYNYEHLEDETSKCIYLDTLHWKFTGDMLPLRKYPLQDSVYSFFDDEFITVTENTTYVDIGAYTGDSIESFLLFGRGIFKKVIGIEADYGNYQALKKFVKYSRVKNIQTHHIALWSRQEDKIFYTNSNNLEINFDSPNFFETVDKIADNCSLEEMRGQQQEKLMHTVTLDDLLKNEIPSIIKINALSADRHIILGGKQILRQYKPILILEFAVNTIDIFDMIRMIKNINPDYKFYMRRKQIFDDIKTILYSI